MTTAWPMPDDAATDSRSAAVRFETSAVRALVVGEDDRFQRWASGRLRRAGYEVLAVEGGTDALAAARRAPPDLVVLDYIVAGMDVREVFIRLRRDFRTAYVPILLIAPRASGTLKNVCHEFGAMLLVTGARRPRAQLHAHLTPLPTRRVAVLAGPGDQSRERRL